MYSMTDDAEIKGFDPFAILGVTPSTEARDIKKQYRALSLIYHPDKVRRHGCTRHPVFYIMSIPVPTLFSCCHLFSCEKFSIEGQRYVCVNLCIDRSRVTAVYADFPPLTVPAQTPQSLQIGRL